MSFDYINDTFGELTETLPKYREVERQAIMLLVEVVERKINSDAIYEGFEAVRVKMVELDDNTIEPGYPLWLSKFLAFHFIKWRDWYLLKKMHTECPERFDTEELQQKYSEIEAIRYDDTFYETCRYCVEELGFKVTPLTK